MCLNTYTKKTEPFIAKKDIVVYKVIHEETNKSIYQNFQYKPDILYRLRKALELEKCSNWKRVNAGFHSYVNPVHYGKGTKAVEFIIPKGAKYFKGKSGRGSPSYVSTSIRSGNLASI